MRTTTRETRREFVRRLISEARAGRRRRRSTVSVVLDGEPLAYQAVTTRKLG